MTVFDDFNKLKKQAHPQIIVIYGEDLELIFEIKKQLLSWLKFDPSNLSHSYFDLVADDKNMALEELESFSFFAEERLVIFENCLNLTTSKKSVFDDKQILQFENWLENPVETTKLILILQDKIDSRLKIVKKIKKQAYLLETKSLKSLELQKYFQKETGFSAQLIHKIAEKSNFKFELVKQNISLLKAYKNKENVTFEDLEKVLPRTLQDNVFKLITLIIQRKIRLAQSLLKDLLEQEENIRKITASLMGSYRLYYQVKIMQEKGWSQKKQEDFLKIHPYRIELANKTVRQISKEKLRKSLKLIINLDYNLKSEQVTLVEEELLFEIAISKLSNC
ncbi:MAG: DNA polymerase III subunit delta [Lactovum sp.]